MALNTAEINNISGDQLLFAEQVVEIGKQMGLDSRTIKVALQISNIESEFNKNNGDSGAGTWGPFQYKSFGPDNDDQDSWETGWIRLSNRTEIYNIDIPPGLDAWGARFSVDWQIRVALVEIKIYLDQLDSGELNSSASRKGQNIADEYNLEEIGNNPLLYAYIRHNTSEAETSVQASEGNFNDDNWDAISGLYDGIINSNDQLPFDDVVTVVQGNLIVTGQPTNGEELNSAVVIEQTGFWESIISAISDFVLQQFNTSLIQSSFARTAIVDNTTEESLKWFSIFTYTIDGETLYGLKYGFEDEAIIREDNQILVVLSNEINITTSQSNDTIILAELGTDIFGAGGEDTISFVLMDSGVDASLKRDDAQDISGSGRTTEFGSIEHLTGTNYDDILEGDSKDNKLIGLDGNDSIEGDDGDDNIEGGEGRDTLRGQDGDDIIHGDDGDDQIYGGNDEDLLYGNDGNDEIRGGSDDDRIFGGDGRDEIYGDSGNDTIVGGRDKDTIYGGSGNDEVFGGSGNDYIEGGKGTDDLNGGSGDDEIFGDDDHDILKGSDGDDELHGGDGDDEIYGGDDDDILKGGNGNDILNGNDGNNTINGNEGDDKVIASNLISTYNGDGGIDTIDFSSINQGVLIDNAISNSYRNFIVDGEVVGFLDDDFEIFIMSDYDDDIYGFNYAERYLLGDGNDKVVSRDGDDIIYGGNGNDEVHAGDDDDTVFGQNGNDDIDGGDGNDDLDGGNGDDIIDGGRGNDSIVSGKGNDSIYAEDGDDHITITIDINETTENKLVRGGNGQDTIDYSRLEVGGVFSGAQARFSINLNSASHKVTVDRDDIEILYATNFDDTIYIEDGVAVAYGNDGDDDLFFGEVGLTGYGGAGNDYMFGSVGADTMYGGADNDRLIGRNGDDILNGGVGADELNGGSGQDTAVFANSASAIIVYTDGRTSKGGEAEGDTLFSIENITGSEHDDAIILNAVSPVDNVVNAGDGNDRIRDKDGGTNTFNGEAGEDRIFGGSGNDTINGGSDADMLFGGAGNDTLYGGSGDYRDELFGSSGNDTIYGQEGNDRLRGQTGQDTIHGDEGDDNIRGGTDHDMLFGDSGNDTILGDQGNDIIDGGEGNDRLFGGNNYDIFVFDEGYDFDRIYDFQTNRDTIDLSGHNISDFDDLQSLMTQNGNHVSIDFGNGDILQINNTEIGDLQTDHFIL